MLIGFTGLPGSGKSEAARHLEAAHGFRRVNVSDPIHAMLRGFYEACGLAQGAIRRRLAGDLKEEPDPFLNGKSPRYAMQALGKEWRDLMSPSLFADRWADRIDLGERIEGLSKDVVADGMRYPDELALLRVRGGILVRIIRSSIDASAWHHPAERQLLPADDVIVNDGSVEELHAAVDALIS